MAMVATSLHDSLPEGPTTGLSWLGDAPFENVSAAMKKMSPLKSQGDDPANEPVDDDPFDDFEEDDFDDDFDDDFEEDWEDDLTEDEEFPDTFGGKEDDKKDDATAGKSEFKGDADFDDK